MSGTRLRDWSLVAAVISLASCYGKPQQMGETERAPTDSTVIDSALKEDSGAGVVDADGDGYAEDDCDDTEAEVHPGAMEICNGRDDDCDGVTDDDVEGWVDGDGDGYGTDYVVGCEDPTLVLAPQTGDCNDEDSAVHPGAAELPCNGQDEDCDGLHTEVATVEGAASYDSIQAAVEAAPEGGTVWVCDGTWFELIDIAEGRILTLAGWSGDASRVVLDGQDLFPLLYVRADGALTVEDLTFTRGNGKGEDDVLYVFGGAVTVDMSSLTVRRVNFLSNETPWGGGAILIFQDRDGSGRGASVKLYDSNFIDNSAPGTGWGGGGALAITGYVGPVDLLISGSNFEGNTAYDQGGTLFSAGHGSVDIRISDSDFKNSSSAHAGGFMSITAQADSIVELTQVRVNGGTTPQEGGVMYAFSASSAQLILGIKDSTFSDCLADRGGALYLNGHGSGMFTIERSVFQNLGADSSGGAIDLGRYGVQSLRIVDSLIEGNYSGLQGGGLYASGTGSDTPPETEITGTTIRDNDAIIYGTEEVAMGGGIQLNDGAILTVSDCDFGDDELNNWPTDIKTSTESFDTLGSGETFTCEGDVPCVGIP